MALLLDLTVTELLLRVVTAELELVLVPLELEAAELLELTVPPELPDLTGVPPLEDAPELTLTIAVPLELDPGVTPPLEEFVCSPLLAGPVTPLEESPDSGAVPLPPSPPHEARTNAAVASKAAIPQLKTPGMLYFFVPGFTLPVGPPQGKSF